MEKSILKKEIKVEPCNLEVIYRKMESEKDTESKRGILPTRSVCEMDDWMKEMDKMLEGFSQQATQSLRNIRKCFEQSGRSFNEDFKKHFLRESSERVAATYTRFEMELLWNMKKIEANESKCEAPNALIPVKSTNVLNENQFKAPKRPSFQSTGSGGNQVIITPVNGFVKSSKRVSFDTPSVKENDGPQLSSNVIEVIDLSDEENPPKLQKSIENPVPNYKIVKNINKNNGILNNIRIVHVSSILKNQKTTEPGSKIPTVYRPILPKSKNIDRGNFCLTHRYKCSVCKMFSCKGKTDYERHMRKHNGDKPYQCNVCMKSYTRKENLESHLINFHNKSETQTAVN